MRTVQISLFFILLSITLVASKLRVLVGGSLSIRTSPILAPLEGKNVAFLTCKKKKKKMLKKTLAGGQNPPSDARQLFALFAARKINATWIPIYQTCKYTTQKPEYLKMVRDADAIYLAGGISEKLQTCLFGDEEQGTSPILEEIKKKDVYGTSAGAMVMPMENMLLTGNSYSSYKAVIEGKLPMRPNTFRMFSRGVIDPHSSERGRQGRLMVFSIQSKADYSFGLDENTAIVETEPKGKLQVIGANGVVIFPKTKSLKEGVFHYLSHGDALKKKGGVDFPSWKKPCFSNNEPAASTNIFADFRSRSIDYAKWNSTKPFTV